MDETDVMGDSICAMAIVAIECVGAICCMPHLYPRDTFDSAN